MKFFMVLTLLVVLSLRSYNLHLYCIIDNLSGQEAQMVRHSVKTDFPHCSSHDTMIYSSWVFLSGQLQFSATTRNVGLGCPYFERCHLISP